MINPLPQIPPMENFTLKVGAGIIHKDMDDQLVGMKAGESKKIMVTFPGKRNRAISVRCHNYL
jgi:FKBP-type peptidyl-prolyl cis-trans isomerase (trigger factor)